MICRANRACLISFYIYFILFIINDFSKSIMTSNFLYMRDITVTHFIVKYTHNLTLSCNCFHNIVFYLIFISVWNIYFKFSIACLRINICNISCQGFLKFYTYNREFTMLQCFRKFAHYKLQITNLKNNIGTYNRKCTSNAYVGPHKNKF